MSVEQNRPSRFVASRSPSPIPDEIRCASKTSKMAEASSSSIHGTTSWIACIDAKRKAGGTTISHIPKSIMHNILLFIPAMTLRRVIKKVCKEWNDIISDTKFIMEHNIHNASDGFLLQKSQDSDNCPSLSYFLEIGNETNGVTIYPVQLLRTIHGSTGSLLMIKEDTPTSNFAVVNPVNGKIVNLTPPLQKGTAGLLFSGIAQAPSTGIHKVVHFYNDQCLGEVCFVLSLGVESTWRLFNIHHLGSSLNRGSTICAGRYVYCVPNIYWVITFDAETESIYRCTTMRTLMICFPYYFLQMGNSLSLVIRPNKYIWSVWKLTDFETGIWDPICKIDLSSQRRLIERELSKGNVLIQPMAWLRNGGLILFLLTSPSVCCIAYDVRKEEFFWFERPDDESAGELAHFRINGMFSLNWP